jgi:hypothetical protein
MRSGCGALASACCGKTYQARLEDPALVRQKLQVADYLFAQEVTAYARHSENHLVGLAYQLQFRCNVSIMHFVQAPLGLYEPEYRGSPLH